MNVSNKPAHRRFTRTRPRTKTRTIVSMPQLIFLTTLLCFPWLGTTMAYTNLTIDGIAEEMLAAETKFTDLRLDYVATERIHTEDNVNPIRMVEGTYAQKMPQALRYLDRKVYMVDPNTEQSTLVVDALASFNGNTTLSLDRIEASGQPMRGAIYAGYNPSQFPRIDIDPHTTIWYFANKRLADILKDEQGKFRIESQSEVIDGLSTTKLVGTIGDGTLTMKLWVCPQRNFLPVKRQVIRTRDQRLASEFLLSNLVLLPNGIWYPTTIRSGPPDPEFALTFDISQISTDPVPEDLFSFEFPPNTHVYDDILKISYTTY